MRRPAFRACGAQAVALKNGGAEERREWDIRQQPMRAVECQQRPGVAPLPPAGPDAHPAQKIRRSANVGIFFPNPVPWCHRTQHAGGGGPVVK